MTGKVYFIPGEYPPDVSMRALGVQVPPMSQIRHHMGAYRSRILGTALPVAWEGITASRSECALRQESAQGGMANLRACPPCPS